MSETMKQRAFRKRNPEFDEATIEIGHALDYAQKMLKAGKLTKAEYADFEGLQYNRYIEALPPDEFHEMMKDGRLDQLQAMAEEYEGKLARYHNWITQLDATERDLSPAT